MSPEAGGRSDKFGNEFENRCLVKYLLRLVREQLSAIIVEPLGSEGEGVEFVTVDLSGNKTYYQCKSGNVGKDKWTPADLNRHKVFLHSKNHIEREKGNRYVFLSPLHYDGLDTLCKKAKSNSSTEEFCEYQVKSSGKYRILFRQCAKYYNLDKDNHKELKELIYILANCEFDVEPYSVEALADLNDQVAALFTGNSNSTRLLLEHIAVDRYRFGQTLNAADVIEYMQENDVYLRSYMYSESVASRIEELNETYWGEFQAINGSLIHRTETDAAIAALEAGRSIVIHGRAGVGKSGCVEEIRRYLKEKHTLFLGIKLDKKIPSTSADKFGEDLGLPQSPVICLSGLAAGKQCVLILDQLDSLRWTNVHSSDALDVCKELLRQTLGVNGYENGRVSIILVSRTFDLENDNGLRSLLSCSRGGRGIEWADICVNEFEPQEVRNIVGQGYAYMPKRMQRLLSAPAVLYVWQRLNDQDRKNNYRTVYDLLRAWWNDTLDCCEKAGVRKNDVIECRDFIVGKMSATGRFYLPDALLIDMDSAVSALVSSGMLVRDNHIISFVHQSFLDYFISYDAIKQICSGKSIVDVIGSQEKQTPHQRYRVLLALQNLMDSDSGLFLAQCRDLLGSEDIRYYYKCTAFEVIGQCQNPDTQMLGFVEQYYKRLEWCKYVAQTVYYGHPAFVTRMKLGEGESWLDDKHAMLLRSIGEADPDFVTAALRPYAFESEETDSKIHRMLCIDPSKDSERMFEFRLELLRKTPALLNNFYSLSNVIKSGSVRGVQLLSIALQNHDIINSANCYMGTDEEKNAFARKNCVKIAAFIFPEICRQSAGCTVEESYFYLYGDDRRRWVNKEYNNGFERDCVEITKTAFEELAVKYPQNAIAIINGTGNNDNEVEHEIVMHTLFSLPESCADYVINWLMEDFEHRVFVYTENEYDHLASAKKIISKFTITCSDELFNTLETKIYYWKDSLSRMLNIYKSRLSRNEIKDSPPEYFAFWGHFQREMLPKLDERRISTKGRELLAVLNRKDGMGEMPYYGRGKIESGIVSSPVDGHTSRLSDKNWLEIVSTPNEKMNKRWSSPTVEASHFTFASSMYSQAKLEPARFARLSLQFPDNCYSGYVSHVLCAIHNFNAGAEKPTDELIIKIVEKFGYLDETNVAIEIARLMENRSDIRWLDKTLDRLSDLALNHIDDEPESKDLTAASAHELLTQSINCVRGCAIHAISRLIWANEELQDRFMPVVEKACDDDNDAVRFALGSCIRAYYNEKRDFSIEILKNLIDKDLRIIGYQHVPQILFWEYENEPDYYRGLALKAVNSGNSDLQELGAEILCAVSILYKDESAFYHVLNKKFSERQENKICHQAIKLIAEPGCYAKSAAIIQHFIETSENDITAFHMLFHDERIDIRKDKQLLLALIKSKHFSRLAYEFMDFLDSMREEEICEYAEAVEAISVSPPLYADHYMTDTEITKLAHCVLRIYDKAAGDSHLTEICLNVWDNLFMHNENCIRKISEQIDNML